MKQSVRKKLLQVFAAGVIASFSVTCASYLGYLDFMQRRGLDFMVWWKDLERPSDIVIIRIDAEAFRYLGEKQPLSREYLARLVKFLDKCGATAIGLDVELRTASNRMDDAALDEALTEKTVIPYGLEPAAGGAVFSPQGLAITGRALKGFAHAYIDDDGVVRRSPLVLRDMYNRPLESFALALVRISGRSPAAGGDKYVRINYAGPAGTFASYPAMPIYRLAEEGAAPAGKNPFRGKIVLIGATFLEGRDFFQTPTGLMSGVEIQANVIHTLLRGGIRTAGWAAGFAIQSVISLAAGSLFVFLRPWKAIAAALSGIFLIFVPLSYLIYSRAGYWVDFVMPLFAICVTSIIHDSLRRNRIRESFSQYVSSQVVDKIYEDESALEGRKKTVTVLFTDIRGFTTLSEKLDVAELAAMLNEYFGMMTDAVLKQNGMINKFIGDAVMAVYNAPVDDVDHALAAVKTAMDMQQGLDRLNRLWQERGLQRLEMGIGIHTGEVFVGNIGSGRRKEYTVTGDAVNLASRIEGLNKELGTSVLISGATRDLVMSAVEAHDRGTFHVKGRLQPVKVHELKKILTEGSQS